MRLLGAAMVEAIGIAVPRREAERVRRLLQEAGVLRRDLQVDRDGELVVFPVASAPSGLEGRRHDFTAQPERPERYQDLLPWPAEDRDDAPRAFDRLGDIAIVKVPERFWGRRGELGEALLRFHPNVRAVFHDGGVQGPFRTRDLTRIAGSGDTATVVQENGVRLHVDPARAYFSPRLADERARVVGMVRAGERVVDLFGGVAPFGVQAAKAGARVVSIDINPEAVALARRNAQENGVVIDVRQGDARELADALAAEAGRFDRIVMNLPHAAKGFLDVAARLAAPGARIHFHEILPDAGVEARGGSLVEALARLGCATTVAGVRHVRAYSASEGHYAFDLDVAP